MEGGRQRVVRGRRTRRADVAGGVPDMPGWRLTGGASRWVAGQTPGGRVGRGWRETATGLAVGLQRR